MMGKPEVSHRYATAAIGKTGIFKALSFSYCSLTLQARGGSGVGGIRDESENIQVARESNPDKACLQASILTCCREELEKQKDWL